MYVYYFIILFPLILSFKKYPITVQQKRIDYFYWSIFFFFLLIIFGLRYKIGGDWNNYLNTFNKFHGKNVVGVENYTGNFNSFKYIKDLAHAPVFALIMKFSQIISSSFIFFNFLLSLIFLIAIFKLSSIYKEKWVFLALLIPYLSIIVHTGYVRQSLAIAFLALTLFYFYEKKFFLSFVLFSLSILTHIATIPFLIIFFKKKFTKFIVFFSFIFFIFFIINFEQIYNLFYYYLGKGIHFESLGAQFRILLLIPFIFLIIYQLKYQTCSNEEKILFRSALIIYFILFIFMLFGKSTFSDRFALSCILFSGMISAKILSNFKSDRNKILFKIIISLYCVLNFTSWMIFSPFADSWIPYTNYLFYGE